jgi:uncharacterized membrane protein
MEKRLVPLFAFFLNLGAFAMSIAEAFKGSSFSLVLAALACFGMYIVYDIAFPIKEVKNETNE